MVETKKFLIFKDKKSLLFILNVLVFVVLLTVVLLKFFVFTDEILPDNHSILSLPVKFYSIDEIFNQPYEEVTSVSTKYSILYKDDINRKMYVFAIPVREFENDKYYLFDNKIHENNDGTFKTQNKEFNVEFNKNSVNLNYTDLNFAIIVDNMGITREENYINTYGEIKETIKYSAVFDGIDMSCAPTYNGLLIEFDLLNNIEKKEITFEIDIDKLKFENDPAGYVQIIKDDKQVGLIYQGIVADNDGNFYTNNIVKINIKNKKYYLTVDLSTLPQNTSYPAKLAINFDFYCFKMFYDTSVYETIPTTNTILNNVSIFDSKNEKNDGYTYLKYNVRSFTPKKSSLVDSFTFNFYVMSVLENIDIEVYRVKKDWCSWTINWKDKPPFREKLGEFNISEIGWHKIDLTDYVKKLIDRNYDKSKDNNSIVLKIKNNSAGYAILASADNTYAPLYFEVNYRTQ